MLGQKEKLCLGLKQFALLGAVFGLIFGSGAFSYTEVFADEDSDWKKQYSDFKKKVDKYKKEKNGKKYKEWQKKFDDFKKKYNNYKKHKDDKHDDDDDNGNDKIYICYKGKDKKIKQKDLDKYLAKGATKGKCHDDDDDDDDDDGDDKKFKKGKVLTGDGPPPDKLGKKGDLYFDSWDDDSLEYYVKIGKKEWELRGTLVEPSNECERGDVLKFNKVDNKWVCVDGENLGGLTCSDGQIAKWNNTAEKWECQEDLVDDADADPANELQDLSLTGQDLSITPAGNTAELPFVFDDFNCPTDEAVIGFDGDGGTNCALVSGGGSGDITAVNTAEGSGLLGGGDEGDLDLEVDEDFIPFLSLANVFTSDMEVQGSLDVGADVNVLGLLESADIFFEFFDGTDCTEDEGCLPGEYLTDESVTARKLSPEAVTLNVVRQLSSQVTIAAGQEGTIPIECDTGSITGFTLLNVGELPGTVLKSIDEGDTDPSTETLTVVNSAAASGTVKVAFYCAELSPLGSEAVE